MVGGNLVGRKYLLPDKIFSLALTAIFYSFILNIWVAHECMSSSWSINLSIYMGCPHITGASLACLNLSVCEPGGRLYYPNWLLFIR